MKNFTIPASLILLYFFSGCEDSVVNNNLTGESKSNRVVKDQLMKELVVNAKVGNETKKQVVLPIEEKKIVKKKPVKFKPKYNNKITKSTIKESPVLAEEGQNQRILDLTLPAGINKQIVNNMKSYQKRAYLPDLFPRKKKKKYPLHVDGKIFDRVEKEADKVSSIDGVGIDVRLYP